MRTLLNQFQKRDRWYTARFDAGDLPSGPYFYRILVDGFAGIIYDRAHLMVVGR